MSAPPPDPGPPPPPPPEAPAAAPPPPPDGDATARRRPRAPAPRAVGAGALVLAALVVGHVVTEAFPVSEAVAEPFVRHGGVGETVALRYAEVTAGEPAGSTVLDTDDGALLATPGVWLTVPLEVVAVGEPRQLGYAAVLGGDGRTYGAFLGGRSELATGTMQPGIPRWTTLRVELPVDAVAGARLQVALGSMDRRGDDLAEIDLALTDADAAAWAADDAPVVAGWYTDEPPERR